MATVAGLFVSPARKSGRSEARERVLAIERQGFEGCAHGNPPRREVLFASKEHLDAVGVELAPLVRTSPSRGWTFRPGLSDSA